METTYHDRVFDNNFKIATTSSANFVIAFAGLPPGNGHIMLELVKPATLYVRPGSIMFELAVQSNAATVH